MYLYRTILKQSLKSTWENKYLWFFGLFAALLGGSGEFQILFHRFDNVNQGLFPSLRQFIETGIFSPSAIRNLGVLAREQTFSLFIVLSLLLISLILVIFIIWLTVVSQAAIVNNTARIKTSKKHNLKEGLEAGMNNFWPILALNAFLKLVIFVIFLVLSLPIIASLATNDFTSTGIIFIVSFLFYTPLVIMLSFIIKYAVAFVIIRGDNFLASLRHGWKLFINNWLLSVEMAFILFFINFVVALVFLLLLLILSVPFLFVILLFAKAGFVLYTWTVLMAAVIFYFITILFMGSFLAVFQINAWTSLFIELIGRGGTAKLSRWFDK